MSRPRLVAGALAIVALGLFVYLVGPSLIASQSRLALSACARSIEGDVVSVDWQVLPVAGWVCQDDTTGDTTYLGWWAS